jgi:hypothetical protein
MLGPHDDGPELLICQELNDEFWRSKKLRRKYTWIDTAAHKVEMNAATITLDAENTTLVDRARKTLEAQAYSLLTVYCAKENIGLRELSDADLTALAMADVLNAAIATDEWPLTHVARTLQFDVFSTVDIVAELERCGRIKREHRLALVKDWLSYEEELPRGWEDRYFDHFAERAVSNLN